jgi:phosphoglycolate phosphatase
VNPDKYYFIFDLDGTLADTLLDIAGGINYMLNKMGLREKTIPEIRHSIGHGIGTLVEEITGKKDESVISRGVSWFAEYYDAHFLDKTCLYDGVREFIALPGFAGSVVTNKPERFAIKILDGLGISRFFDICIGGRARFPHKPDPAGTLFILDNHLNGRKPVLVGDSLTDYETAQNAGVPFCYAEYGYNKQEEEALIKPDFRIKEFRELMKIF